MSLNGVHIACGYVGGPGGNQANQTLARKPSDSETLTADGTSRVVAPGADGTLGLPAFEIRTFNNDIWFAIGKNPDATKDPRLPLSKVDGARNVFCEPGDKIAIVTA